MGNTLITPRETAALLGITVKTLNVHVHSGEFPYVNVGTGKHKPRRMFCVSDIDAFVLRRTVREISSCSTNVRVRRPSGMNSRLPGSALEALRASPTCARRGV